MTNGAAVSSQFSYDGLGNRVGQTIGGNSTTFVLDVAGGLPEVIYTSADNAYLHLPGAMMTEDTTGQVRYLLSDGLGSVRQAVDELGRVTVYHEFDPYGGPVENGGDPYGYTGEWWQAEAGLLHLRARWYAPGVGVFLSRDPVAGEPPYQYVRGNPVNFTDPSGYRRYPPRPEEWVHAGGPPVHEDTYWYAINIVFNYRHHIIAAAERHFITQSSVCSADAVGLQKTYTLAGVIYQESIGRYREIRGWNEKDKPSDSWKDKESVQQITFGLLNTSVGIAQIKDDTGADIEASGLLYDPYNADTANPTLWVEHPYDQGLFGTSPTRLSRLLDPVWAIEYAATNLERATQHPTYGDYSNEGEWERMVTFYRDAKRVSPEQYEVSKNIENAQQHKNIIWANMEAIRKLDVLGLSESCEGGCK